MNIKIFKIKCHRNTKTSILVYKYRPKRTGFNMYAENILSLPNNLGHWDFLALVFILLTSIRIANLSSYKSKVQSIFVLIMIAL